MPQEANALPTSRIARWVAAGALIVFAAALYFREGRRLPPLTATPAGAAGETTEPTQPTR